MIEPLTKICPCGKSIEVKRWLIHRKKYCSKPCHYKYHGRRSGLKYKIRVINLTWFSKGNTPWNFGLKGKGICKANSGSIKKGTHISRKTEFKKGHTPSKNRVLPKGTKHNLWKGDKATYASKHHWIKRELGRPIICEICGAKNRTLHWSNRDHKYKRVINDWQSLCVPCHKKYDKENNGKKKN